MKNGFTPIGMDEYIRLHLESNPDADRETLAWGLRAAFADYKVGVRCTCGKPLWVVGSAVAGNGCFTCITGEESPDGDYEIDEAMA